ncbi:MAG: hypothetical protein ACI4NW_07265 [Stenotrophomonas sp.]
MSSNASTPRLAAWLAADNLDAAIEAGLLQWSPDPADDPDQQAMVQAARQHLLAALAARERHRNRAVRLRRIAAERDARRTPPPASPGASAALPSSVAAILARAKARAAKPGQD